MDGEGTTMRELRPVLLIGSVVVVAMLLASGTAWALLPAGVRVPVHWDVAGEVDRYGGRIEGLLALPALTAGLLVLFRVLPAVDPRGTNVVRSARAYRAVVLGVILLLGVLHGVVIAAAFGGRPDAPTLVPAAVGVLFVVVGNYLPKTRPNWTLGIRTPWTLSSERSWRRTHRLGGPLFVGLGLVQVLSALLLPPPATIVVVLGGAAATVAVTSVYSWWVWRSDPERTPAPP